MKKLIIFIVIILLFSGCSNEYETWQKINMPDVGSFKMPKEWVCNEEDDIIYIADMDIEKSGDFNTYLIGILSDNGKKDSSWNLLGKQIECGNLISSEVFSNSCTIGKKEFWIDGKICERFFVDMVVVRIFKG